MEQHPIPQQISSYQFRLVGDMTLKQFFQLAGGAVVSLIFYSIPLHPLIKWPLVFFFALLGVALAFLPFEDRPLEVWIAAFFRSIYSPTIYAWRKFSVQPKYFKDETVDSTQGQSAGDPKLNAYLAEADAQKPAFAKGLDSYEKSFLSGISSLFGGSQMTPKVETPVLEVPEQTTVKIAAPTQPPEPFVSSLNIQAVTPTDISPLASKGLSSTAAAVEFSSQAAPPSPPTVPNTISGQVLDSGGKIVESAILEIRDASGRPVRALRTNKLGHFTVVTPLISGPYEIVTEKEGLDFEPLKFDAMGELIQPIVVRAEGAAPN